MVSVKNIVLESVKYKLWLCSVTFIVTVLKPIKMQEKKTKAFIKLLQYSILSDLVIYYVRLIYNKFFFLCFVL